jgi:hypothetical protein
MASHINTYNRAYLWRILHDHIYLLKLKGNDYVRMVIANFKHENNTHIFNFILSMTAQLLSYHLEGSDES